MTNNCSNRTLYKNAKINLSYFLHFFHSLPISELGSGVGKRNAFRVTEKITFLNSSIGINDNFNLLNIY